MGGGGGGGGLGNLGLLAAGSQGKLQIVPEVFTHQSSYGNCTL